MSLLDQLQPIAQMFGMGDNVAIFLGLSIVGGVILLFALFVPILNLVIDISPYAYPNARIRGMEANLLTSMNFEELIETPTLMEALGYLERTDYEQYLTGIEGDKSVEAVERALYRSLAETYETIERMAPAEVEKVFEARLRFWEIRNLKAVLRALHAGVPVRDVSSGLVPIGQFSESELETFYDLRSVEEAVSRLESTEYGAVLAEAMTAYSEMDSVQPMEVALDKYVYERLWKKTGGQGEESSRYLKRFFGTEIDVKNLKTLLRAKVDDIPTSDIVPLLLPGGHELDVEQLETLADGKDVESVVTGLEGTVYGDLLVDVLPEFERGSTLLPFEQALDRHLAEAAKSISNSQPFGIGPIIGYLSSKDLEVRNLRCIIRGIGADLSSDEMRKLLVEV